MADEPEKIWLRWEPGKAITQGPLTEHPDYTEYIRTDQHLALVAAAYEVAAKNATTYANAAFRNALGVFFAKNIRALTPEDAVAELERVKREARNEALREAAEKADKKCCSKGQFALAQACVDAILELMEKEQTDE